MIVPSIDLMDGQAVQLVGGREKALDAGDPRPIARRFGLAGEVAVIDLDAALGQGSNATLVTEILDLARCRVGGGIRDVDTAIRWLDAGAARVILGTAATPDVLSKLPRDRVIAALDAVHGEVVVHGWRTRTGRSVTERLSELSPYVGGFLVTFVEREGRLQGIDLDAAARLREACGDGCSLTVAGGVTTIQEIAALDAMGIDAQVGMALYTDRMHLADAIVARLITRADETLWPTVIVDELGVALGLAWSNVESLRRAVETRRGVYWSRSRGALWEKGTTSGDTQELLAIDLDCDRDCLRFTVRQHGRGFCHTGARTCWGEDAGLPRLVRRLRDRLEHAPPGSYTRRLFDAPDLLRKKLLEEAEELAEAPDRDNAAWETADLLYFALAAMIRRGAALEDVMRHLDRRALKVTRRD